MIALAFLAGLWTATLRARRENIPAEKIADVTLWLMVGGIIGARFVYVTTYWREEFASQPLSEIFMIQHGGLVYYGGFIGATVAGIIYIRWKKMPLWKTVDGCRPASRWAAFLAASAACSTAAVTAARRICRGPSPSPIRRQTSFPARRSNPAASDGNLRRAAESGSLRFSGMAVPAQKIRRPDFCDLSALLRRHALDCRILSRRLFQSPLPPRPHAGAMDWRPDFCRRPRARGGPVATRIQPKRTDF